MITTPIEKQRAKSYYLGPNHGGRHDEKSLGNNSVRVDQKRRSNPKYKGRNKSLERDTNYNSKSFKNPNKSMKKVPLSSFRISR
jgi:hypothetical protein